MRRMPKKQDDYIKTALRLPRELHTELTGAADREGRSLNSEIIARLQRSFSETESGAVSSTLGNPQVEKSNLDDLLEFLVNELEKRKKR